MGFLIQIVFMALTVFELILLARVLMSWFPLDRSNPTVDKVVRFIYGVTEPVLKPIRDLLPPMPIDLSPLIVFLIISLLMRLL
jgi:YggT family protein